MATLNVVANPAAIRKIARFTDAPSTGIYADDCQVGRDLADELIQEMRDAGFPGSLGHVVRDLAAHGTFNAVQVGFFQRIAELAIG